jgi:hypothetical protein
MFLRAKQIVGLSAALLFVAAWFANGFLDNTYVSFPQNPNEAEGRVIPYAVKGVVVFITARQHNLLSWLSWIQAGSGLVTALVILLHRGDPFKKNGNG